MTKKPKSTLERFEQFLKDCPDVLPEFIRIAKDMKSKGYHHYSADGILHILRWHRNRRLGRGQEPFKMNNSFAKLFSQLAMTTDPELDGFFRLRNQRRKSGRVYDPNEELLHAGTRNRS